MKTYILLFFLFISCLVHGQNFWGAYWLCGTLTYTDPENDEVYWVITAGNTTKFFAITPCTGVVKVDTMAYETFTYQKTYTLTFKCTDTVGNSVTKRKKVLLKKTASGTKFPPTMTDA